MGTQRQIDMTFDISYPSDQAKFLQRLGEKTPTDIVVQVFNKGVPYNLSGTTIGFEMRNDKEKILIDKDQSRFTLVLPLEGVFSYRPPLQVQSFYGNSYLAYFTFESGANRVTTERFRFYNDEDVQLAVAPELQEHYVSVIDDLVASNKSAMDEAKAVRDLINANQVVRKTGDTLTGSIKMTVPAAGSVGYGFQDTTGAETSRIISIANGNVVWQDRKNLIDVLTYSPATKTFTMQADTNLVKKAGDTMTGDLRMEQGRVHRFLNVGNTATVASIGVNSSGRLYGWSDVANAGIFEYDPSTKVFNLQADTNLMKKTDYSGKDGQINLTLTANASTIDGSFPPVATRRGNTVTVRLAIMRTSAGGTDTLATIPSPYRPITAVAQSCLTVDGTAHAQLVIGTDGIVQIRGSNAQNKGTFATVTFVTD